jgi:hypothetical protein
VLDTISGLVGKPWITQETISKIYEQRKWNIVNNEKEGRTAEDRNELKGATEKAKKVYLERICDKDIGF